MRAISTMNSRFFKMTLIGCFSFLCCFSLEAQQKNYHRVYNLFNEAHANTLDVTSGNGFVTSGYYQPSAINGQATSVDRAMLVKLDAAYNVVFAKHFIESIELQNNAYNVEIQAHDVKEISGGDFIIAGRVTNNNVQPASTRAFLMKTNPMGNVLWFKEYFFNGLLNSVVESANGGFVACGYTELIPGDERCRLLRTDASGNPTWLKRVDTSEPNSNSAYREVIEFAANKFAIVGNCNTVYTACGVEKSDVLFTVLDETGATPYFFHHAFGRGTITNAQQNTFFVSEFGNTLINNGNDGVILAGHSIYTEENNCSNISQDVLMIGLTISSTAATISFSKEYPIQNEDMARDIVINGNEIGVTGKTDNDAFLLRTTLTGGFNGLELFNHGGTSIGRALEVHGTNNNYTWIGAGLGMDPAYKDVYLVERNPLKDTPCHDWDEDIDPVNVTLPSTTPDEVDESPESYSLIVSSYDIPYQDSILCEETCLDPIAHNDTLIVCNDSTYCINVLLNDIYGTLVSSSIITPPSNGMITSYNPMMGELCYNPSVSTGTDLIEYEITDNCGSDTASVIIIIEEQPSASYTVSGSGLTLSFTDASTGNIDSWYWTFDDGTSSTLQNPTHTFPGPGVYMVCLTVTNECGSDTYCMPQIDCAPPICNVDHFTICDNLMTLDLGANDNFVTPDTFTVLIPPALGTLLSFNSATGVFTYSGPSGGFPYTDSLKYILCDPFGCCESWAYITVLEPPTASFTYTTNNHTVFLNNTSTGDPFDQFLWDFGDGNVDSTNWNPVHTYASASGYAVCLTVWNECGEDTFCDQFSVDCPPPIAQNDTILMCGDTLWNYPILMNDTFSGSSMPLIAILTWPTQGSLSINPVTGNITYILTDTNYVGLDSAHYSITDDCGTDDAWIYFNIQEQPFADFGISQYNLTFTFTDQSTGNPTSWYWDFGDGNTSTLQSPTHTYSTMDMYTVCLTVTNDCGQHTNCMPASDCAPPIAVPDLLLLCDNIGSIDVSVNDTFANPQTFTIVTPPSVSGATATLNSSTGWLFYSAPSGFTGCDSIQYELADIFGTDTAWVHIKVAESPTAIFATTTTGLTVDLTNYSTGSPIESFMWDFGDGTVDSTNWNTSHTYATDGIYTICLFVSNHCGWDITCLAVEVDCPPTDAVHDDMVLCPDETVNQDLSVNDSWTGTPTFSIEIAPLNGTATIDANNGVATYTPDSGFTGSDGFWYRLEDACGWDTVKVCVDVLKLPVADFTYTISEDTAHFTNLSSDFTTILWNYGDNIGSFAENPSHIYTSSGSYTVTLTVYNDCGSDSTSQVIDICLPMNAMQDTMITCEGDTIIQDLSINDTWSGIPFFSIEMAPSNGTATINASTGVATYIPNAGFSGTDEFWYKLEDDCDSDTTKVTVIIGAPPISDFSYSVSGNTASFTNLSSNYDTWLWYYGDNIGSFAEHPTHTYSSAGTYTVNLVSYNDCGVDTATQILVIDPPCPLPIAQNDTIDICEPGSIIGFNPTMNDSYTDPITVNIIAGPFSGVVHSLDTATGEIVYEAGSASVVCDSIQYTLTDLCGGPDTAWIHIKCSSPGSTPVVLTCITVFLEGPYLLNTGAMAGNLTSNDLTPCMEPYADLNSDTYLQATTESILDNTGITGPEDWVCVQLRDKDDPDILIATKSGLLTKEGKLVSGANGEFKWFGVEPGDYYVAIFHRNHLPICSSSPITLPASGYADINFADGSTPIYGNGGLQIDGKWMMIAGDVNGDGAINVVDNSAWFQQNGLTTDYDDYEDMNMDGAVNAADKAKWTVNNSHQAQLPFNQ